jgi:type II secretory pathway component PulF
VSLAFRYRAATAEGRVVEGQLQAASPLAAQEQLRRQSLVPVSVDPDGPTVHVARPRRDPALASSLRALATLLAAGQSLEQSLDFASRHAASPGMRRTWQSVLESIRTGDSLSEAMAREPVLSAFAVAVVRAGEESGSLDAALQTLASHQERSQALAAEIRAALLYPAMMGIVAGAGTIVVLTVAVPRFIAILGVTGGTLPLTTRVLVGASAAVAGWWWFWVGIAVAGAAAARVWLSEPANRRRWHAARLRLPVVGPLEFDLDAARFCRALGVLLGAGVPMLAALRLARAVIGNLSSGDAVVAGVAAVARGERVADSLAPALPPLARQLLRAGEESGQLDTMCARVADSLEDGVQRGLRQLVRLLEPALIVAFGVIVGFVALAMLQAMYGVNIG